MLINILTTEGLIFHGSFITNFEGKSESVNI